MTNVIRMAGIILGLSIMGTPLSAESIWKAHNEHIHHHAHGERNHYHFRVAESSGRLEQMIGPNQFNKPFQINQRQSQQGGRSINEETAVRIARQHFPGKVLGVRLHAKQGLYMVKMMTRDAKITVVKVDQRSGQIVP